MSKTPLERADEILERSKREFAEQQARSEKSLRELENNSMKNFAAWRDYLHKYNTVILLLVGATGILENRGLIEGTAIKHGLLLALSGVLFGYIWVNVYLYIERRWLYAHNTWEGDGMHGFFEHELAKKGDPIDAVRCHMDDAIKSHKTKMREIADPAEKLRLKRMIRGDRMIKGLMKYVGAQFQWIEKLWLIGVALSFFVSMAGVFVIFWCL